MLILRHAMAMHCEHSNLVPCRRLAHNQCYQNSSLDRERAHEAPFTAEELLQSIVPGEGGAMFLWECGHWLVSHAICSVQPHIQTHRVASIRYDGIETT